MAIRAPGYRPVNHRINKFGQSKKSIVAVLSLTAMVDMFTVLTIFLLQNYNPDMAEILDLPEKVTLPKAEMSRPITPSHVVNITADEVSVGDQAVATVTEVLAQEKEWQIQPLFTTLRNRIAVAKSEYENDLRKKVQDAVYGERGPQVDETYKKVTVQADKSVNFAVIKRVMYTITQAGGGEISFAVLKRESRE